MGNASELSINVVNFKVPKLLTGINQKVCGRMPLFRVWVRRREGHRRIDGPYPSRVMVKERGKPVSLPSGQANRKGRCWRCGYGMAKKAKARL